MAASIESTGTTSDARTLAKLKNGMIVVVNRGARGLSTAQGVIMAMLQPMHGKVRDKKRGSSKVA
jgi:hypothetical protein